MRASELKRGDVVAIAGAPHAAREIDVRSPSSRGATTLYKVRFTNLLTQRKYDATLKGDDVLDDADVQKTQLQYSYDEGNDLVFMDTEDYSQFPLSRDQLTDQLPFITEGLEGITGLIVEGALLAVELPQSVVLQIVDTAPAIKGASASARTKPATLVTGHVVQVPEYLANGEYVKVNTGDGKFMSRA
ncbi:MAG: elongation factor P-like protein YeiP [Gammaproteobacteria bacterium]|nr:elongation factor P-like protein YeiP [Gammaproteobacteria bacterium]|tara:strand:- start:429 stop:992 length:564 start_codon:yes stop_codon:yes gene_type:complete